MKIYTLSVLVTILLGFHSQIFSNEEIDLYGVNCYDMNPYLMDSVFFYYQNNTLVVRDVDLGNCCEKNYKATVSRNVDTISISIKMGKVGVEPDSLQSLCTCDCLLERFLNIPIITSDSVFIRFDNALYALSVSDLPTNLNVEGIDDNLDNTLVDNTLNISSFDRYENVMILDLHGTVVLKSKLVESILDVSFLLTGKYYVVFSRGDKKVVETFVKY